MGLQILSGPIFILYLDSVNGTGAALLFILFPLLWYLRFQSMNWLIYRELQMKQIFIAKTEFGKILRWLGSTTDTLVQNSDEEQQAVLMMCSNDHFKIRKYNIYLDAFLMNCSSQNAAFLSSLRWFFLFLSLFSNIVR